MPVGSLQKNESQAVSVEGPESSTSYTILTPNVRKIPRGFVDCKQNIGEPIAVPYSPIHFRSTIHNALEANLYPLASQLPARRRSRSWSGDACSSALHI